MLLKKIIIFVKAPEPGRVKTRLCPPLSSAEAALLYQAFVQDTLAMAAQIQQTTVELAYEPTDSYPDLAWLGRENLSFFKQEGKDLGSRLIHAFERAFVNGSVRVVIIGSDSPALPSDYIRRAFAEMDSHDVALGPTADGGYYLIGLTRPAPQIFQNISWSTAAVYNQTVGLVKQHGLSLAELPLFWDIDKAEDLALLEKSRGLRWTAAALKAIKKSLIHFPLEGEG